MSKSTNVICNIFIVAKVWPMPSIVTDTETDKFIAIDEIVQISYKF